MTFADAFRDLLNYAILPMLGAALWLLVKLNSRSERMEARLDGAKETNERHEENIQELYGQTRDIDKRLTRVEARVK